MSLLSIYQQFLRTPNTSVLADNAAIYYIPTLTTINEPAAIIRHLQAQGRQLKKKSETALDAIEGASGLHLDTETTIEFISGGGAYLPGLDDNFIADKIVTLPLSHAVHFDEHQKISHIRISWDQGSLLKQIDVIGARGRNWPLRDGKDQARLIASNSSAPVEQAPIASRRTTTSEPDSRGRSRGSTSTSATGDPHASLSLFAPRQDDDGGSFSPTSGASVATRVSARPPTRDLTDLLAEDAPSPASTIQNPSPKKNGNHARAGAGKNYHPVRLFDENDERPVSPEKVVKPNSKKYQHFEFGQGEEAPPENPAVLAALEERNRKHASQWAFEDFVTPDKVKPKLRTQDMRTFGWSDDEEDGETSPIHREVVHQPRPDAKPHFEFADDGTPIAERKQTATKLHKGSLGLYKDHILGDDDAEDPNLVKKPLSTVTNIKNQDRHRDFDSQFEMTDASPVGKARVDTSAGGNKAKGNSKPNDNQKKVLNGMSANWGMYDNSPDSSSKESKEKENRGIKAGGNGMGGRKGATRHWGIGD
ncbi:hypothetical protein NA57DRAFT_25417, partial [Rhizodiscina lignyota]